MNDYYWLNIGLSLSETCTFLHYVETRHKSLIEYREDMNLQVKLYSQNNFNLSENITYTHFGRSANCSNIDCYWIPIQNDYRLERYLVGAKPNISVYPLEEIFLVGSDIIQKNPSLLLRKL